MTVFDIASYITTDKVSKIIIQNVHTSKTKEISPKEGYFDRKISTLNVLTIHVENNKLVLRVG